MSYAFILLAVLGILTMSLWSGASVPVIDEMGFRASIQSTYEHLRDRVADAAKKAAKDKLHGAVEEIFEE